MIPIKKVRELISRHKELENDLSKGEIKKDDIATKSKEYSDLNSIINIAKEYEKFEINQKDLQDIISNEKTDKEFIELAKKELNELIENNIKNEKKLKIFLLPKDDADSRNAIIEIRAGTGGLEASLFASDLFKMYEKISNKKKMEP